MKNIKAVAKKISRTRLFEAVIMTAAVYVVMGTGMLFVMGLGV